MINFLTNFIINLLLKEKLISIEQSEVYSYGIEMLIATLINFSIAIVIGFIFDCVQGTLIFLPFFCILRSNVGGFHCSTHKKCILCFTCIYIFILYTHQFLMLLPARYFLFMSLLSTFFIYILAPVEDVNRPIKSYETIIFKTKIRRIIVLELVFSLFLLNRNIFPFTTYSFLLVASIVCVGKIKNNYIQRYIYD